MIEQLPEVVNKRDKYTQGRVSPRAVLQAEVSSGESTQVNGRDLKKITAVVGAVVTVAQAAEAVLVSPPPVEAMEITPLTITSETSNHNGSTETQKVPSLEEKMSRLLDEQYSMDLEASLRLANISFRIVQNAQAFPDQKLSLEGIKQALGIQLGSEDALVKVLGLRESSYQSFADFKKDSRFKVIEAGGFRWEEIRALPAGVILGWNPSEQKGLKTDDDRVDGKAHGTIKIVQGRRSDIDKLGLTSNGTVFTSNRLDLLENMNMGHPDYVIVLTKQNQKVEVIQRTATESIKKQTAEKPGSKHSDESNKAGNRQPAPEPTLNAVVEPTQEMVQSPQTDQHMLKAMSQKEAMPAALPNQPATSPTPLPVAPIIPKAASAPAKQAQNPSTNNNETESKGKEQSAVPFGSLVATQKLGFFSSPDIGGSSNPDELLRQAKQLGAKSLVVLNPSSDLIKKAEDAGIKVIARVYTKGDEVDHDKVKQTAADLKAYVKDPNARIITTYNEPNLDEERAGKPFDPVKIAEQLIQVRDEAKPHGVKVAIPAMAQGATVDGMDEKEALRRVAEELKKRLPSSEIERDFVLDTHSYVMSPEEAPKIYERIQSYKDTVAEATGATPKIVATEIGLWQNRDKIFSPAQVEQTVKGIVSLPIPDSIKEYLISGNLWILDVPDAEARAQKDSSQKFLLDFQKAALINNGKLTPAAEALARLNNLNKEQATAAASHPADSGDKNVKPAEDPKPKKSPEVVIETQYTPTNRGQLVEELIAAGSQYAADVKKALEKDPNAPVDNERLKAEYDTAAQPPTRKALDGQQEVGTKNHFVPIADMLGQLVKAKYPEAQQLKETFNKDPNKPLDPEALKQAVLAYNRSAEDTNAYRKREEQLQAEAKKGEKPNSGEASTKEQNNSGSGQASKPEESKSDSGQKKAEGSILKEATKPKPEEKKEAQPQEQRRVETEKNGWIPESQLRAEMHDTSRPIEQVAADYNRIAQKIEVADYKNHQPTGKDIPAPKPEKTDNSHNQHESKRE